MPATTKRDVGKLKSRDHYQVKYEAAKLGIQYGIANMYGEEFEKYAKRGQVLVDHAVFPTMAVLPEAQLTDLKMDYRGPTKSAGGFMNGLGEYHDYVTLQHVIHQIRHDRLPSDQVAAGHLFAVGVGDGAAYYCVTKAGQTSCQIEWRGFCLDRWFARPWGFGGKFRTQDVAAMIGLGVTRIFGPKPEELTDDLADMAHAFVTTYAHLPLDIETGMRELGLLTGDLKGASKP
jgi:hypothetical protein